MENIFSNTGFVERFEKVLEYTGLSKRQLDIRLGWSNGMVGKILAGKSGISVKNMENLFSAYPEINAGWLLTGLGRMVIGSDERAQIDLVEEPSSVYMAGKRVPYYGELWATAGPQDIFSMPERITEYVHIPGLTQCDAAISILGDSMVPRFHPGDIVMLKQVTGSVMWGEVHLVITPDHRLLKYVQRGQDETSLRLVSANEFYGPIDIRKVDILKLYQVKGRVQRFSM